MTRRQAERLLTELLREGDIHEDCGSCRERAEPVMQRLDANERADRVLRAVYVWCAMAAASGAVAVCLGDNIASPEPPWFDSSGILGVTGWGLLGEQRARVPTR